MRAGGARGAAVRSPRDGIVSKIYQIPAGALRVGFKFCGAGANKVSTHAELYWV